MWSSLSIIRKQKYRESYSLAVPIPCQFYQQSWLCILTGIDRKQLILLRRCLKYLEMLPEQEYFRSEDEIKFCCENGCLQYGGNLNASQSSGEHARQ